jgi:hypothetical protein
MADGLISWPLRWLAFHSFVVRISGCSRISGPRRAGSDSFGPVVRIRASSRPICLRCDGALK